MMIKQTGWDSVWRDGCGNRGSLSGPGIGFSEWWRADDIRCEFGLYPTCEAGVLWVC